VGHPIPFFVSEQIAQRRKGTWTYPSSRQVGISWVYLDKLTLCPGSRFLVLSL